MRETGVVSQRPTSRWEAFWFEDVPPHSYALLRIAFGLVGLLNLVGLTPVSMYWPIDAIAPVPGGGLGVRAQIASLGLGTVAGWALFSALLVSFSCMIAGYRSALAVPAAFVLSVLQAMWNPLPLSGANQVLVSLLFCLMWADCGRVLSVDARRGRGPLSFTTATIWPMRLLRLQVALIYLNTGLWKLFAESWRDGTAMVDALHLNIFHRFPVIIPDALHWIVALGTYVTLFWELGFAFMLFWPPTRRLALGLGIVLHAGMWLTLEVGPFSFLMMASYIAFLDPHAVARRVRAWRGRPDGRRAAPDVAQSTAGV